MSIVLELLDDLRRAIAPEDVTLKTARERRDDALDGAKQHPGVALDRPDIVPAFAQVGDRQDIVPSPEVAYRPDIVPLSPSAQDP